MGNTSSNSRNNENKEFANFYDIIDYIATYYILTMDFKSLNKLSEKEYCDKLVVLTADIIKKQFSDLEITYLAQRIKQGQEINQLQKDRVSFINKDKLDKIDISQDLNKSIKKKRVCIGIAKFYVKIAHIFAAIVMTINPVYTYKDATGQLVKTGLMEKDKIPKNTPRTLYKLNICDERIRALKRGQTLSDDKKSISIHPKVCDINLDKNKNLKTLNDEPGIPELMRLYFDDNYDYGTGEFIGMSEKTKKKFRSDLEQFYKTFTGNKTLPDDIQKFSDIKLRDYSSQKGCQGSNPPLQKSYNISIKDNLYVKYAENIKNMMNNAVSNQKKLLSVINDIFIFVEDPYTKKKQIRVNPSLNEKLLQDNIIKTRKFISNLYLTCESDYVNGIKLYESIVEAKILETTKNQIANLEKDATTIMKTQSDSSINPTKELLSNNMDNHANNITKPANKTVFSSDQVVNKEKSIDENKEQITSKLQDIQPSIIMTTPNK
jgi:hypothetical protein